MKFHGLEPRCCKGIKGILAPKVSGLSRNRPQERWNKTALCLGRKGRREGWHGNEWKPRRQGIDCLLSLESQLDDNITWKLLTSFSRLFTASIFTRAYFSSFFTKCVLLKANYSGKYIGVWEYIYLMRWPLHQVIYDLSRTSFFCDSSFLCCFRWHLIARFTLSLMTFSGDWSEWIMVRDFACVEASRAEDSVA